MAQPSIESLLASWREADRHWEATPRDHPGFRAASVAVLRAWLSYHAAVDDGHAGEFALVADGDRIYVAASAGVDEALGYSPEAMIGRRVEEFAAAPLVALTAERWATFMMAGRQDGEFEMLHRDGSIVRLRYQARAHFPIADFHLSRLWPATTE